MGIKERRTKILTSLFLLSDTSFKPVTFSQSLQTLLDLSFNQKTKKSLTALLKDQAIKQTGDYQYSLTDIGFEELCLKFPFFRFLKTEWDGKWRIISYEIPEKKREMRDRLRREMQGWGLGPWHRSFWLTPHPIIKNLRQLTANKEEEQYIQAFEADHSFGIKKILIDKVWETTLLDKQYRTLFKQWHDILAKEIDKQEKLRAVISDYVAVLKQDPGLPKDLIGENWIGFEAYSIFNEIKEILLG
jgi:phenylacetic acid degradation operon negative regulatory protein